MDRATTSSREKTFITNGPYADFWWSTPSSTIPRRQARPQGADPRPGQGHGGFVQSKPFQKMGIHSSAPGSVFNKRSAGPRPCSVRRGQQVRRRPRRARSAFPPTHRVAAMALGVIEECLRLSVDYAKNRVLWVKGIAQYPLIQLSRPTWRSPGLTWQHSVPGHRVGQGGQVDLAGGGLGDQVVLLAGRHRCRDGCRAAVRRQRLQDEYRVDSWPATPSR
jgi:hypothetical protein